jgi:hypothetical protein
MKRSDVQRGIEPVYHDSRSHDHLGGDAITPGVVGGGAFE